MYGLCQVKCKHKNHILFQSAGQGQYILSQGSLKSKCMTADNPYDLSKNVVFMLTSTYSHILLFEMLVSCYIARAAIPGILLRISLCFL